MSISMIAAIGQNNELGKGNDLIWKIKKDMKIFRETTSFHTIVMGRKTLESFGGRLLPNRKHVVLSRNSEYVVPSEVELYRGVKEFLEAYKEYSEEIFVIGGGEIYREFLPYADTLYLTEINDTCNEADAYFPFFDREEFDSEIILNDVDEKSGLDFKHVIYKRKSL